MKVREFIQELQKLDPDLEVIMNDDDYSAPEVFIQPMWMYVNGLHMSYRMYKPEKITVGVVGGPISVAMIQASWDI